MDYKLISRLQTLLPLGYFYLIVLGILKDGIFFYLLGINIIKYSSITDVLMSPISDMTAYPILLIAVSIIIFCLIQYNRYLVKNSHKKWIRNSYSNKRFLAKNPNSTEDAFKSHIKNQVYYSILMMIASFFLGGGIGFAITARDRIKNDDMKFNYKITYDSGKETDIYLIDSNSEYHFYVEKGQKNITIAPNSSIKKVELIKNRMLN